MPPDHRQIPVDTIDAIAEPNLRFLFHYWQQIRKQRPIPLRSDFDPLGVPKLLKDLFFVEVHGREPTWRFRYRVAGTGISGFVGEDYTGRFFDEIFPEPALSIVGQLYSTPVRLRLPVYSVTHMVVPGSEVPKLISRLVVPLSGDGETIDMLLSGQHYNYSGGPREQIAQMEDYKLDAMFAVRPD
jgi:hypothetical protein